MTANLISLAVIMIIATLSPMLAEVIPGKVIPETVFLLLGGAILGPHLVGIINANEAVDLLSDLGMGFLFLLAGYEIDPKILLGKQGRRGLRTWLFSFVLAIGVLYLALFFLPEISSGPFPFALALVLTTTALGALIPIMKERGIEKTRVGTSVLAYGTWGELGPVLAMAVLLSTRSRWETALVLLAFVAFCVICAAIPLRAKRVGDRIYRYFRDHAFNTSQSFVRWVVMLLIILLAAASFFHLDIVLGAFAAGFILRFILPRGNSILEEKLEAIGYGFLIPVFFVISGADIDLSAIAASPLLLIILIIMLIVIRMGPIYIVLHHDNTVPGLSNRNKASIAFYCTTALPLIVAITSVAVNAGTMDSEIASVLISAGAVTMFLMPLLGKIFYEPEEERSDRPSLS